MPLSKKVLEDSIRLDRIRRIKMMLYLVQVVMLAAFAFVLIFLVGGAKLKPSLYLPLDVFIAVMVLLLLVICIESFFFRIMEIRFARSSSSRHLMAKNSRERAIAIVVISAAVTAILMIPTVLNVVEEASEKTVVVSRDEDYSFWSRDPLAFQKVPELRASSTEAVRLYLVKDSIFTEYNGSLSEMYLNRVNRDDYVVDGSLTIIVPDGDHTLYYLVVDDLLNPGTSVTVVLAKETSEMFTGIVSLLALAFAVTNVAWIAYLIPIEKKYSHGSIYK